MMPSAYNDSQSKASNMVRVHVSKYQHKRASVVGKSGMFFPNVCNLNTHFPVSTLGSRSEVMG